MKKTYERPTVICETMQPEAICSNCIANNPQYNEAQQCGYTIHSLGVTIFVEGWAQCGMPSGAINELYCYQPGTVNLFTS